jgi:hypothetical protein
MSLDRIVLALNAAFVLLAGVACVVAPASFAQQAGLSEMPRALTEIRAFHGGLVVGFGCFLTWCIFQRESTFAGLLLVVFTVGGAGVARVLGMLIDREPTAFHLTNLAVEAVTVVVVTVVLARHRRLAHARAV